MHWEKEFTNARNRGVLTYVYGLDATAVGQETSAQVY